MPKPKAPDDEFIRLFEEFGAAETARRLGQGVRDIYARRKGLEGRIKRQLVSPNKSGLNVRVGIQHPGRIEIKIADGGLIGTPHGDWSIIMAWKCGCRLRRVAR